MNMASAAVVNRLARQGLRDAAESYREEVRLRLRREGAERADAVARADAEMMAKFEPIAQRAEQQAERAKQAEQAQKAEQALAKAEPEPQFIGFQGDVDALIDPDYCEPDAGRRLRDAYVWVGDEFRRITLDTPGGNTRMEFGRAKAKPPTPLAVAVAEYYGEHRAKRGELFSRLAQFAERQHQQPAAPESKDDGSSFLADIE
jgi:hypothetical protein